MSHSLPRGWALQTHTLHTQPCGARQPLRPPSGRCQSLATDQLPRGEVGGLIQLTRQKVARHLGGRGSLYLPFKALIPSRASLESQNSGRQTDHLFLGGTTQTLQGCVTTPPPPSTLPPRSDAVTSYLYRARGLQGVQLLTRIGRPPVLEARDISK